jgi:iron complex transport system substrate-binding protein
MPVRYMKLAAGFVTALGLAFGLCARAAAADPPRRVVSFNICADQLVIALADPEQIVGVSPNAADPAMSVVAERARDFRRLGWQAEATIPLKPDLVLLGAYDRSVTRRLLSRLGFRIVEVDLINDIAAGVAQIRQVAALLGHPERGEALIAEVAAARRRLAEAAHPPASTALLISNGGYTIGPASLAGALLAEAGLKPPQGMPAGYGGVVSLEKLIALRPDFLAMFSPVAEPDSQGAVYLTHPALRALYPAARRIILPERYTVCGGPSLVAALDFLTGIVTRLAADNGARPAN